MTKHTKPLLLLLLATLLFNSVAIATERIDIITRQSSYETIIRNIDDTKSLICDQTGIPFFIMYIEGVPTLYMITIDLDTVYDFEIFNDTVFFCGVKNNGTSGYGVLGYFPMAGFPSTTVSYLNVPLFKRVKRIEVGEMSGQTHMVAVGDGIQGKAELVDAIYLGFSWDMNFFSAENDSIAFTDLAITDTYVVVTGFCAQYYSVSPARIYYFKKPTSGGTLAYPSIQWIEIEQRSSENIIIEACQGDAFVVALANGKNEIGKTSFTLVAYDALSFLSKNSITEPFRFVRLRDIKYYAPSKSSELLLYVDDGEFHHSVVYTLTSAMAYGTSIATGHKYNNVFINSLDWNRDINNHFVASANRPKSLANIQFILYDFSQWGDCLEYAVNEVKKIDYVSVPYKTDFGHVSYEQNPAMRVAAEKKLNVNNDCTSN